MACHLKASVRILRRSAVARGGGNWVGSVGWFYMCDRVDQLPIFPYNRGWETQLKSVGFYRAPL